jgi:hypothetical protein
MGFLEKIIFTGGESDAREILSQLPPSTFEGFKIQKPDRGREYELMGTWIECGSEFHPHPASERLVCRVTINNPHFSARPFSAGAIRVPEGASDIVWMPPATSHERGGGVMFQYKGNTYWIRAQAYGMAADAIMAAEAERYATEKGKVILDKDVSITVTAGSFVGRRR